MKLRNERRKQWSMCGLHRIGSPRDLLDRPLVVNVGRDAVGVRPGVRLRICARHLLGSWSRPTASAEVQK